MGIWTKIGKVNARGAEKTRKSVFDKDTIEHIISALFSTSQQGKKTHPSTL